jgi:hypothetical protein
MSDIKRDTMRKLGWSQDKADLVENRAKKFFSLAFLDHDHYHIPDVDVDELWHRMILHTQWYCKFCDDIFGTYYHHTPEPDASHLNQQNRDRSEKLMQYWFQESWDKMVDTCTQCSGPTEPGIPGHFAPDSTTLPNI